MQADDWAAQRARAVAAHAAEQRRREDTEAGQAEDMLRAFAEAARAKGIPAVALVARSYDGGQRYRTGLRGWYLRPDGSVAVGTDGCLYLLGVRRSLRALLTGVRVAPARPRLVLGEGGRDGDRITLRALLDLRLS